MINNKSLKLFILGFSLTITSSVVFSVLDSERYEYLLYKNVQRTKLVFIEEQKIVQKLQFLKIKGYQTKDMINSLLGSLTHILHKNHISRSLQIHSLWGLMNYTIELVAFERLIPLTKYHYSFRNIEKIISAYGSAENIMAGAKKGVIVLRQTYGLNVTNFSRGILQLKDNRIDRSRVADNLKPDDLVSLATMAFDMFHWYDSGLLFLKEALNSWKTNDAYKMKTIHGLKIGATINQLISEYISLHNQLLTTMKTHNGQERILFPFFVEKGLFPSNKNIHILSCQSNKMINIYIMF